MEGVLSFCLSWKSSGSCPESAVTRPTGTGPQQRTVEGLSICMHLRLFICVGNCLNSVNLLNRHFLHFGPAWKYQGHIWALQIRLAEELWERAEGKQKASLGQGGSVFCPPLADTLRKVIAVQGRGGNSRWRHRPAPLGQGGEAAGEELQMDTVSGGGKGLLPPHWDSCHWN